tara:strand:- start:636 stop:2258 length:1623 start_codon:yes stop_codon:yes gene_type:complete
MKKLSLLFTLLIFFGCSNDDSNSDDNQQEVFGTKEITVVLELPENSNINPDDLTISTIFTEDGQVNDGTGNVKIFDNNAIELVYATNSSGNLILMSYFNPTDGNAIELNSKTTAQSLAMLHPWTMNLSVQARQEAFQEIALIPEFNDYHNQVIQGINSGEINPLATSNILQAIDSFQNTLLNRVEIETLPLLMVAENSTVNLTNKKSSMAYNLQMFDENNQPIGEDYTVDGINKEILSWSNVLNILGGNFDLFQPTDVQFPIPSVNQQYNLKADRWSGRAYWKNGASLASSIVGIVSTTLGTILKGADCGLSVGTFFANGAIDIIQTLSSGQLTASQAANQLNTFLLSRTVELKEITAECSQYALTELGGFGKILGALSLIGNFENGVVLFFNIADIAQYDSEIEFCFERTENEIVECEEFNLSGVWVMEDLGVNCSSGAAWSLTPSIEILENNVIELTYQYNVPNANNTDLGTYSFDGDELHFQVTITEDCFNGITFIRQIEFNGAFDGTSFIGTFILSNNSCEGMNDENCQGQAIFAQ